MPVQNQCTQCRAPIGLDDRLCWSCGGSVRDGSGTTDPDLNATVDRAALAALTGAQEIVPEMPAIPEPASEHEGPVPPGAVVQEEGSRAEEQEEPEEAPATAAAFCASCGWSFAGATTAKFCGSCGTARRHVGEQAGDPRPVRVPEPAAPAPPPTPRVRSLPGLSSPASRPAEVGGRPTPAAMLADPDWSPDPLALWRSIGPIDRSWSGRVKRGWAITKLSLDLMKQQPGLIGVPIIVTAVLAVIYILMAIITAHMTGVVKLIFWLPTLAAMASIAMTGQAVITQRIAGVITGSPMTNGQAFDQIKPRLKDVCCWGMLTVTVGLLIRSLTSGRGLIGIVMRLVRAALLIAWTSMTFFVLPVILFEGLSVGPAITRSKQLVRVCWGEGLIGVGILNALFNVVGLGCFLLAVLFSVAHLWVLAVLILLATIIGLNLLSAVASPVFTLVMYRYATSGQVSLGFSTNELAAAFRRPKAVAR